MIHTSLSPNTEKDDLWKALQEIIFPWRWYVWKKSQHIQLFEEQVQRDLGVEAAISFQRGRDALQVLLKTLEIGDGDEVILQAYTCLVVPNAIQFVGATPIYVDIVEDSFNIDPRQIEKSITPHTKAVIVQHTFGDPADLLEIKAICKKHELYLIEDAAHSLTAEYRGKKIGTFGDAAILSFGRDKVISSVWGGMVLTTSPQLGLRVRSAQMQLKFPSAGQILQALLHPLAFAFIKPWYRHKWARALLLILQKIKWLPPVIFPLEKKGLRPKWLPQRLPGSLARLAAHQWEKRNRFQKHREKLAKFYTLELKDLPDLILPTPKTRNKSAWLRYTIRTKQAAAIVKSARKAGIFLGDWYQTVLAPSDIHLEHFQYHPGSCPRAEKAALESLNLPTHIQMTSDQAKKVIECVKRLPASSANRN